LNGIAASGATWIRIDVDWPTVESTRGVFNWSVPDRAISQAIADGLKVDALATYTPTWAETSSGFPDPSDYAQFISAAVAHYAPMGVHTWEIWNEPNLASNWGPTVSPSGYAQLLEQAYPVIKGIDPSSTVVSAGLSPATDASDGSEMSPETFLTDMYAAGAHGSMDAVGIHPYSFPYAPMDAGTWNTFYELPAIYAIMEANGDGAKKIWSTEFGWPTTYPSDPSNAVSEATQATYLTEAYQQLEQWSFAGPAFWYDWSDGQDSTGDFGLVNADFTAKPALAAFTAIAQNLAASS